jgi:hypothetical protein
VTILAVGFGSSEGIDRLGAYQDDNFMPFVFAEGPTDMVRSFKVTSQSTKFGLGSDGIIRFRHGYGTGSMNTWAERLSVLASNG